ncbi:MAG: type II toxin-antitoxin system PemK/MazF family toxin [Dehalococcoidia bacterium]|nr:type II toxin-antitoxin system PemK/MazF family toxin [Dehalococcoidia bacterium]
MGFRRTAWTMTTSWSRRAIRRGDVFWVEFDPVVGSEIAKLRPAVIVSSNPGNQFAPVVTVVPFTTYRGRQVHIFEALVPDGSRGLAAPSVAKGNQIRTVDKQRLHDYMGTLSANHVRDVDQAIRYHLDLM